MKGYLATEKKPIRKRNRIAHLLKTFLLDWGGIFSSIAIVFVIAILMKLKLWIASNYTSSSFILGNYNFVIDFFVVFVVSLAANPENLWGDTIGAFGIAAFLGSVIIPEINSSTSFLIIVLAEFCVLYFSGLAGNLIRQKEYNTVSLYSSYGVKMAIVGLLLVMSVSAFTNPNTVTAITNLITQTINSIDYLLSGIGGRATGPAINSTWANSFFAYLNQYRVNSSVSPLRYCQVLSNFAEVRFQTMVQNYEISHYGYNQDFSSFFGVIYNVAFAEEYFHPDGYTPQEYPAYIMQNAPIHWQGLMDSTYKDYGYYTSYGPSYAIYGPNGSPCPTSEIPGPNINIPAYFAQYGCTTKVINSSWFVIELASSCP